MGWTIIPKGSLAEWGLKILMVLTPAFATGAYSYYSAKAEANVGYKTLVTRVDELEATQNALIKELAFVRGEVEAGFNKAGAEAPSPAPPALAPTRAPRKQLPRNLDEAVQQKMF